MKGTITIQIKKINGKRIRKGDMDKNIEKSFNVFLGNFTNSLREYLIKQKIESIIIYDILDD
jgi:hypothetical protein